MGQVSRRNPASGHEGDPRIVADANPPPCLSLRSLSRWPAVPGHADRVAADVTAQAMRTLLEAALASLSTGDRGVLLLIAWEQLTYQEVSRALGIPVGTVQSRMHQARTKVRRALAGTDAGATYEELTTNE